MAIKDPEIGVRAVIKDIDKFMAGLEKIQLETTRTARKMSDTAKKTEDLSAAFNQVGSSALASVASIAKFGAAIAAAFVGVKTLIDLGTHGAIVSGVEESYSRLMHVIGVSADEMLARTSEAAAGLISNFNIMRQTNILIAGATQETAQSLAEAIPDIINISRTLARATGGDIDYYFNSLVQGIKRFEPRLIDNTGLIIKVGEATRTFAEAMDISTQNMTAEQKTLAILNATLLAGNIAMATYGDVTDDVQERMSQLFTQMSEGTITADEFNTELRRLRESSGSMFESFTAFEQFQRLRTTFEEIRNSVGQALEPAIRIAVGLFNDLINVFKDVIEDLAPAIAGVFEIIGPIIAGGVSAVISILRPIANIVKNIFIGVLKVVGWFGYAFATIMLTVANTIIFPVILGILETLASWMVGHSPPPAGPLKDIDIGGQRIMEAWIMGMAGVTLDPVHQVLREVNDVLGDVQFWDHEPVKARLLELDLALRPFEERVKLLSAHFEAMKEPIEAAFRSIDRQLETAVKAMLQGDQEAAALVRQLDAQRQALREYVNTQEEMIDNSRIQLQFAKAQQSLERTILEIQMSRLGPEEKAAKIREARARAERAAAGGAGITENDVLRGAGNLPGSEAPAFGFESGVEQFLSEIRGFGGIGEAFDAQKRMLGINETRVGLALRRMAQSNIGQNVLRFFGIDPDQAAQQASESIQNIISTINNDQDILNLLQSGGRTFVLEVISGAEDQAVASDLSTRALGLTLIDSMLDGALTSSGPERLTLEFVTGLVDNFAQNAPKVQTAIQNILAGEGTVEDYQVVGATAAGLFRSGITTELEATDPRSPEGQRFVSAINSLFSNTATEEELAIIAGVLGQEFLDNFIGSISAQGENGPIASPAVGNNIVRRIFEDSELEASDLGGITATAYALAIVTHLDSARNDAALQNAIRNIIQRNASEEDFRILGTAAANAYTGALTSMITRGMSEEEVRSTLHSAFEVVSTQFNDAVNAPIRNAVFGPADPGQPPALAETVNELPDMVLASFAQLTVRFNDEFIVPIQVAASNFTTAADNIENRINELLDFLNSSYVITQFDNARTSWTAYAAEIASAETALERFQLRAERLMNDEGLREALWFLGGMDTRSQLENPSNAPILYSDTDYTLEDILNGRAAGGPVAGGMTYLVGERGPEILKLPSGVNGWIYNTSASRAMVQNRSFSLPPEDTNARILSNVFADSMPRVIPTSTSVATSLDNSTTYGDIVFNNLADSPAALRRFMMMKVVRR